MAGGAKRGRGERADATSSDHDLVVEAPDRDLADAAVAETVAERHGASIGDRLAALRAAAARADLRLVTAGHLRALADAARRDLDYGLAFPLVAAVWALGIACYFSLPREPWLPAVAVLAAICSAVAWWLRRRGARAAGWVVAAALTVGMATGAIGTRHWQAPRLDHERTVTVEGRVVDVDATVRGGTRMGVAVTKMEGRGLTPETTPTLIAATLTLRGGWIPTVGDGVHFKARLKPPEGPVIPGGYDFARRAWFDGRGASGYLLGRATPIDLGPPDLMTRALAPIGILRHAIADHVRASLPGATGTIAAALMVGEQRAIPDSANEPLRASGLTHIVSISGLHMSLVAGGVITAMRLFFVLFPALALRFPVKKWAAGAAIFAATVYLLLSGNQVAALRSHLMLSIALLAVVVDRPAITMHTVAVSAVAILAWDPSQVMEPSFLMSYLAVIALVAGYDLWRLRDEARPAPKKLAGPLAHGILSALRHVEGLAFSSLVAGLATAPVIAGIFYRGAPYSIIANMIVLPVTGLLIMPAVVVSALLMPFGLDAPALWLLGQGIDFMVAVGRWASSLPGGTGYVGLPHAWMMPMGILAVLWLSLWRSRVRLLGLVPALACAGLLVSGPSPDVFVGRHGSPVAVRGIDGRLHVLAGAQDRFDTAIWLAADADPRPPDRVSLADGWQCDPLGCVFRLPGVAPEPEEDVIVAVVRDARAFEEDCRRAAVVVSALEAPPGCADRTTVVDRMALAHGGATTLTFRGDPIPARRTLPAPTAETGVRLPSIGTSAVPPAIRTSPAGPADDEPGDDTADDPLAAPPAEPSAPRRDVIRTTSLSLHPRPWSPRDRLAEQREAALAARISDPSTSPSPRPSIASQGTARTISVDPTVEPVPTDPPSVEPPSTEPNPAEDETQ